MSSFVSKDGIHVSLGSTTLTDKGFLAPYLTASTMEQAKEALEQRTVFTLEKMTELGGKLVEVLLIELGSEEEMIEAIKGFHRYLNDRNR